MPLGGLHVHVESAASFSVWLLLTHRRTLKRKFLDLENEIHHSLKVFRVEQSAIRRADSEARVHELIGADALRVALTGRCGRRGQGGGSIVNVASISGLLGLPVAHTYTAAKGAVINLTRSLCVTYAPDNIRSNCVAPGFIDTPMVAGVLHLFNDPAMADRLTPMKRPGTAEEMAYGCLYLGSDEASYCNGTVLVIDGGTTARQ